MHVRGIPGSHTLLRLPPGTWEASSEDLQYAANLAAYFSKAREASKVGGRQLPGSCPTGPAMCLARAHNAAPPPSEAGVSTGERGGALARWLGVPAAALRWLGAGCPRAPAATGAGPRGLLGVWPRVCLQVDVIVARGDQLKKLKGGKPGQILVTKEEGNLVARPLESAAATAA